MTARHSNHEPTELYASGEFARESPGLWTQADRQRWFRILLDVSCERMTKRQRRAFVRKYPMIAEAVEGIVESSKLVPVVDGVA